MAVLGKLRRQTGLTIVVIGFAMLSFLIVDAFSNNPTLFGGGDPNNLAKIDGTQVSYSEYETLRNMASQSQRGNTNENVVNTQVWNQLVESTLLEDKAKDVGLMASPMQVAAQFFGVNSAEEAQAQLAQIKAQAQQGNPQAVQQYNYWVRYQKQFKKSYLGSAYRNLVMMGVESTQVEANFLAKNNAKTIQVEYAFAPYTEIEKKNKVEVTDAEIESYVAKYPAKFKSPGTVDLSVVYFKSEPSAADDKAALAEVSKFTQAQLVKDANGAVVDTLQAFANVKNDSVFITNNSDEPFIPGFVSFAQVSGNPELASFVQTASPGQVKGPYKYGGSYFLSKLLKRETVDSASTSHILITFKPDSSTVEGRAKTVAKALADSLLAVVKADKSKFAPLAMQFSEDPGSAQRGGSYPWMTKESTFVKPYKDFAFNNPEGTMGVVETQFGYHVMKVDQRKAGVGYKIANLVKNIRSSKETDNELFQQVNKFELDVKDKDLNTFVNVAAERKLNQSDAKDLDRYAPSLGYIQTDKDAEVLRWAFKDDTSIGDIYKQSTADGSHIVVKLTRRSEPGLADAATARKALEPMLKNEKLAQAVMGKKLNMSQLVQEYAATKDSATLSMGTSVIPGKGLEPAVVGIAMGLKDGSVSQPIQGNTGVYIVKRIKTNAAAEKKDLATELRATRESYIRVLNATMMPALRASVEIEDNRDDLLQ